jgi:hypothetical protein
MAAAMAAGVEKVIACADPEANGAMDIRTSDANTASSVFLMMVLQLGIQIERVFR